MKLVSTPIRYGVAAQVFHWATAILVVSAWFLGREGAESEIYAVENAEALKWHESLGMLVLVILVLRLLWRMIDHVPDDPPMPRWMLLASRLFHRLLYVLLVLVPATAILGAWYSGHALSLFWPGDVPSPVTEMRGFGRTFAEIHGLLANILITIAGLHAVAALIHHFVLRDRLLLSMLPFGRIPSKHLDVVATRGEEKRRGHA